MESLPHKNKNMNTDTTRDCESSKIEKLLKLQLPNGFKKIGFTIAILSLLGVFLNKYTLKAELLPDYLRYMIVVGLLLVVLSRDKIEDEFIQKLRLHSFLIAFVWAVGYAMFVPIMHLIKDSIMGNPIEFVEAGDFVILWTLMCNQILFFAVLKRFYS